VLAAHYGDEAVKPQLEFRERVHATKQACQRLLYLCTAVAGGRLDEGVTVGEVVVELALAHADGGSYLVKPHALDAALGDELRSTLDDPASALPAAARLRLGLRDADDSQTGLVGTEMLVS